MSFRYTNRLFCKYIRCTLNRHCNAPNLFYKSIFRDKLNVNTWSNKQFYGSAATDAIINISILPQHIIDGNFPNNTLKIENIGNLSQPQKSLLLEYSGKLLSNKSLAFRIQLCNKIFQNLCSSNVLTIDDYNTYIKVSTENEVNINSNDFLTSLKCEPNEETFKLLLENACEKGDIIQAYHMLSKMKNMSYAVDERIFNALVLVHAIAEGLQGVDQVLATMKSAQIVHTSDTNWNILIGLANRDSNSEFMDILEKNMFTFNEELFMKLLLRLGLNQNHTLIEAVKKKFSIEEMPRHLLHPLEHLCIHLIHRNKAETAVQIYCTFVREKIDKEYGRALLEEMLETDMDSNVILNFCKYFSENERNPFALECVTDIALRKLKNERAWYFLEHFSKLRPHYFWPLLLSAGKVNGEKGVIGVLERMANLNVEVDSETFERYVFPFSDLLSPKDFLMRVRHLNFSVRQLLTPIFSKLLKNGQIARIHELCDEHKVILDGSRLINALSIAWKNTKDTNCILRVLKMICETNETAVDYVGNLLSSMLKACKTNQHYKDFLEFTKMLSNEKLLISSSSNENLLQILQRAEKSDITDQIEDALDELMDHSIKEGSAYIAHPKNMTVEELECHLIELTNKNMETRGVVRHLIRAYSRLNNHSRIKELKGLLGEFKYKESPGMMSAILHTYIKTGESQAGLEKYEELRSKYPSFKIDEYKLVDLAALLVSQSNFETAVKLLEESCQNRVIRGGEHIERNCIELLKQAKTPEQAQTLFEFLIRYEFCKPKNIILGVVLRSYIECNALRRAVDYYEQCTKQYKCTPLQVELMQILLKNEEHELLKRTLDATTRIYGKAKAQMSLAVALAEVGMRKPLMKLVTEMNYITKAELQNRCGKWVKDGKLEQLLLFADACSKLRSTVLDLSIIHLAIVQLYAVRNDAEGAQNFINKLKEDEVMVSLQVMNVVNSLLMRTKTLVNDEMKCEHSNKT